MAAASTLTQLLALLGDGSSLLTPSAASARALRFAFDEQQRAAGLGAWEPPAIFAFGQWTSTLWTAITVEGRELRLLLNEAQEHALWREIVSTSEDAAELNSADALADLARSAFHLAAACNATAKLRAYVTTSDTRLFSEWADAFLKRCGTQQLLSSALLNDALCRHAESHTLAPPATLHLAGFLTLDPSQQSLLDALAANGCTLHHHALTTGPCADSTRAEILVPTERDELALAAQWSRTFLEHRESPARIAIILPTLAADRAELEVALRETLAPELDDIDADLSSTPWEFSTGQPLSSLALIADALDVVRWCLAPLPLSRISALLLSPYLGRIAGLHDAAILDAQILRRETLLRPELNLPALLNLFAHSHRLAKLNAAVPAWLGTLQTLLEKPSGNLDKPRPFAEWAEFIRNIVRAANWPGDRTLSATDFEATLAWDSTLDLIATLDFSGRRVRFVDALQALDRQCRSTTFAPPSTNAPVQILAPEDSSATFFDAAIFLRATDTNWPRSERPNPLLGFALQRQLHMPGTDAALVSANALKLTQDLAARTTNLLFTHAAENSDGPQRSSPILASLNLTSVDASWISSAETEILSPDFIADDHPVAPLPSTETHGGSHLLKLQATCGFLAFAELRLRSEELEARDAGLDPRESGNILHGSLERFWKRVHTRDNLAAMPQDERERLLIECIDASMPARISPAASWDLAYLTLQKDRLCRLLLHWLSRELDRGPFEVIKSESDQQIQVGPLNLNVRVDRTDRVVDGFVFVDYKTGLAGNPREWIGERPSDPQLPLYSLLFEPGELQALVFAKVRAGKEAKWLGYQAAPGIIPSTRSNVVDLETQTAQWRDTLTQLASDFYLGRASVSPRSFEVDCRRCAQRLLCRINPESLLATSDEDEDTETNDA